MPDQKISQMDPATALTGAELVPVVQSGGNVQTTTQDIANLVSLSSLGASANGITLIGHTFAQMRADLDLEAGTDFVAYSAYSANALTLIGHTFAQMRTDLSLVPGTDIQAYSAKLAALAAQTWAADTITYQTSTSAVSTTTLSSFGRTLIDDADAATARTTLGVVIGTNVQAYDADTAKTDVAQSWTANQIFGGSTADVASFYRSGAAAKTRWIEGTNNNAWGIRNDSTILKLDYNGTDRFEIDGSGNITVANTYADVRLVTGNGSGRLSGRYNTQGTLHDVTYLSTNYKWDTNAIDSASLGTAMLLVKAQNGDTGVIEFWTGAQNTAPTQRAYIDNTVFAVSAAIIAGGPVRLASYTVAGLPAGSTGDTAYASNGRKNGEGAGAGTGVLVFKDGTAWRACDTGATVAA